MNATRRVLFSSLSFTLVLGAAAAQVPTWTSMAPAGSVPAGRYGHVLCAIPGGALLFGGHDGAARRNDTWTYDAAANTWTQVATTTSPSARRWAAAAFHEGLGGVLLFGGDTAAGNSAETWRFDGTTWTLLANGPAARFGHAMAYDAARSRVVMFGGSGRTDTWEHSGTSWSLRTGVGDPGERTYGGMAFDRLRLRIVLHCGAGAGGAPNGTTWEYDGNAWLQQPSWGGPAVLGPSVAFDGSRGRMVSFAGQTSPGTTIAQTHERTGNAWAQRTVPTVPPTRYGAGAAYVPGFGTLVFGGAFGAGGVRSDTLRYAMAQPASYQQGVSGCSGITLEAHDADHKPWLGDTFYRRAFVPGVQLCVFATGEGSASVALGGSGLTGCVLGTTAQVLTVHLSTNGWMEFPLVIPSNPVLHGFVFSDQLAVFQPGVNPAGIVLSNSMTGTARGK